MVCHLSAALSIGECRPYQTGLHAKQSIGAGVFSPARAAVWLLWLLWLVFANAALVAGPEFGQRLLDYVGENYGPAARNRVMGWETLIANGATLSESQKLRQVNEFFNQLAFISDQDHWGKRDYWATPIEMLGTRGGDCEDFSIAKYFTLRQMGVDDRKLRITYVKALKLRQAHMVLAYYAHPAAEPLILDNLIAEIRPGAQRNDLLPVYSFNGDGLWKARERGQGRRVGTAERLNLWRQLNARMDLETDQVRAMTSTALPMQAWQTEGANEAVRD